MFDNRPRHRPPLILRQSPPQSFDRRSGQGKANVELQVLIDIPARDSTLCRFARAADLGLVLGLFLPCPTHDRQAGNRFATPHIRPPVRLAT